MYLCLAILALALAFDLTDARIPARLTFWGILISQMYSLIFTGSVKETLIRFLTGIGICMILFPLFAIGSMGGGDLKLMIILPALLGQEMGIQVTGLGFLLAAIMGTVSLMRQGIFTQRIIILADYLKRVQREGRLSVYDIPPSIRGCRAPHQIYFTVPLFIAAAVLSLWRTL